MTEDEVFAEFFFTTIVIPAWRDAPGYKKFSKILSEYHALPGSKADRLEEFVRNYAWGEYTWGNICATREGRNP